jgi:hypothetical protein
MRQVAVVRHYFQVLRIDIGAHGKELVNHLQITFLRHHVKSGRFRGALRQEGAAAGNGG